jgi:aliphatic nitrilase
MKTTTQEPESGDTLPRIKLAAVQAASVHLDREASVAKACTLIAQAGAAGAQVIAFPEGFIPAHPCWFSVRPPTDKVSLGLSQKLFQNAVVIPSEATHHLGEACRLANITAVIGVCEKRPDTTGTMYNTQIFIGPDGQLLGKHQKLLPTLAEKIVHTGGHGDTLNSFQAPFGRISGLICGENGNPLAVYHLLSQYPVVHVASWPAFVSPVVNLGETILTITRGVAYSMGCFVLNATGVLTQEVIDVYQATAEPSAFLDRLLNQGYASIIAPSGQVISQPIQGEGIVYADVDLNDIITRKIALDYAGHYSRPDVFDFKVKVRE